MADLLRFSVPTDAIDGAAAGEVVSGVTNTGFNIVLLRDARAADAEADADALAGIEAQFAFQYDDDAAHGRSLVAWSSVLEAFGVPLQRSRVEDFLAARRRTGLPAPWRRICESSPE